MLSIATIQTAAEQILGGRYAGETVYRDLTPLDFDRPSFLVECDDIDMEDAGCAALDITMVIAITIFVAVDEYHHSHIAQLQQRMMAVQELFAVGYLKVGDRALRVTKVKGNYQFDFATVRVTLRYSDDRPGEDEIFEAMGEVHTTIKEV